jgi:hypothetical protein
MSENFSTMASRHCLDSWAGQVLIPDLHLGVLTDASLTHGRNLHQRLPHRDRNRYGAT